jgi:hypothetical protein
MLEQLSLPLARSLGHAGAELATDRAEREAPGFSEQARALILQRLGVGPASGEDCTDYCREKGLRFADGRALGSIYSSLRRAGLIEVMGYCARRNGHGTAGGIVWRKVAA